jgi:hypothetical protein
LKNNIISQSEADDGINIKNSKFAQISDNIFKNNYADHIDLDNTDGNVFNNEFVNEIKNKEGDGLDLSGSNVIVSNNNFYNFEDKGISVGEKSKTILESNIFKNNRSAITAKDQSLVILTSENIFTDNQFDIEMYVKKPFFTGATVCNLDSVNDLKVSKINFLNSKISDKDIDKQNIYIQKTKKQKFKINDVNNFSLNTNYKNIIEEFANLNCKFD